jgi:hypothetical protein
MRKLPILVVLAVGAAWAQKVHTEFDEAIDFTQYETYALRDGRIRAQHPLLDNSLVERKIQNAIKAQLSAKGLQEASGRPDIVVTYVLGAMDKRDCQEGLREVPA